MRELPVSAAAFLFLAVVALALVACGGEKDPADDVPDPRITAEKLLELHGLLGRSAEERTDEEKDEEVDRAALSKLIADLDAHDEFIADIYVGFLVGALAGNQERMMGIVNGQRATVTAGKARLALVFEDGVWKFSLEKSVPPEIKERAKTEKKNYEEAKARAEGSVR